MLMADIMEGITNGDFTRKPQLDTDGIFCSAVFNVSYTKGRTRKTGSVFALWNLHGFRYVVRLVYFPDQLFGRV